MYKFPPKGYSESPATTRNQTLQHTQKIHVKESLPLHRGHAPQTNNERSGKRQPINYISFRPRLVLCITN